MFADRFGSWLGQSLDGLLDGLGIWRDIECVLGEFPGNSWHVRRTPGEDFPPLTEEFDERAFLCGAEVVGDQRRLGGIRRMDLHLLCVDGGVERHVRCVLSCDWGCPIICHLAEP